MDAVDRNVLGFLRHREALRTAGRATRHGVLLYGPPGTGKTLVTRYLARSCSPCTVLLLSGRQYAFLRPTCQLARLLAPSVVVLEDADLIAAKRDKNRHAPLLHELMDEMDGLGPDVDCVFLLTTNRPESLEPALVARPGRIDQAIYFPLPDLECRRRLFTRFGVGLDVSAIDLAPLLARTEGASPAFLKELFRRARCERSNEGRVASLCG
jgi:ATP-dependent 26S proteasome regulatory subunit